MAWYRCGGGAGLPASLKTGMNNVLNKKFGTVSQDYPPIGWPDDVNLLGLLEEKAQASASVCAFSDGADDVPTKSLVVTIPPTLSGVSSLTEKQTEKTIFYPMDIEQGSISGSGYNSESIYRIRTAERKAVTPSTQYKIKVNSEVQIYEVHEYADLTGSSTHLTANSSEYTFTTKSTTNYLKILFRYSNNTAITPSAITELQVTDGDFYWKTYTASLGRTIYGGQADIVNGACEPINWLDVPERAEMTRNGIISSVSSDGTITASGQSTGNGDIPITLGTSINLKGGETYTFSIIGTDTRSGSVYVYFAGGSYISISNANHSGTYTPSADQTITGVTLRMFNTQTITLSAKIQLEKGSTASDYSPYFEPFTFDGQEIPTKLGYNAFWSDEGDTEVTYRSSGTIHQYPSGEGVSF